tara:strand:- start:175 stop:396 length:222 start_codon:yes stop_codon:yes gene_type:complete
VNAIIVSISKDRNPLIGKVEERKISRVDLEKGVKGENEIKGTNQFGKTFKGINVSERKRRGSATELLAVMAPS